MVAAPVITVMAQKETAKQALLKQLRDAGATSPQMPGSLEIDGDEAEGALAELLAAGTVKQGRPGAYYLAEAVTKDANPGMIFVAILAVLIVISFTASVIAIAAAADQ